jgi:cytochrome c peroxidase
MTRLDHRRHWFATGAAGAACVLSMAALSGQDDPLVKVEPLAQVIARTQKEKPTFAKRQQDLLAARYDLADRPARGVTMTRGKAVQEGVRVKLAANMTWEQLAALSPEDIRKRNAWPAGFLPLPHPHHEAGGMIFPKPLIDETIKQTGRDLTRFDLDFDLPDHLLPEFPAPVFLVTRPDLGDVSKGELITLDNFERLFLKSLPRGWQDASGRTRFTYDRWTFRRSISRGNEQAVCGKGRASRRVHKVPAQSQET